MFLGFTFAALTIPCMIIYLSKPHDIPIVYPAVHSITLQYIDTHIALIDTHTHIYPVEASLTYTLWAEEILLAVFPFVSFCLKIWEGRE